MSWSTQATSTSGLSVCKTLPAQGVEIGRCGNYLFQLVDAWMTWHFWTLNQKLGCRVVTLGTPASPGESATALSVAAPSVGSGRRMR